MKWFSYDFDVGLKLHSTAKEAAASAQEAIEDFLDGEWNEDVETVCWGQVLQRAVMKNKRPDPDGTYDYICDYELETVKDDEDERSE